MRLRYPDSSVLLVADFQYLHQLLRDGPTINLVEYPRFSLSFGKLTKQFGSRPQIVREKRAD